MGNNSNFDLEFASPRVPNPQHLVSMDSIGSPYLGRRDFTPIEE